MPVTRDAPAEERIERILAILKEAYPAATIALDFTTPLECVVATILSAQSTDARVNIVTKDLFKKYRRPEDYLAVPEEELQIDIQSTGFFRQKTKSLRGMSQTLMDEFDGEVPRRVADLLKLKGVARKTANVVQSACFPEEVAVDPDAGIAVDTHVGRVSVRLGLTKHDSKEAVKIEQDLMRLIAREEWPNVAHEFILHGRTICDAKKPLCADCPLEPLCPSSQEAGLPDLFRVVATKRRARTPKGPAKPKVAPKKPKRTRKPKSKP
jgi:endonuclease III